jgi:hypothetical protein
MGLRNNILLCISNLIRDEIEEAPAGFFDHENLIRDEIEEAPAGFFDHENLIRDEIEEAPAGFFDPAIGNNPSRFTGPPSQSPHAGPERNPIYLYSY